MDASPSEDLAMEPPAATESMRADSPIDSSAAVTQPQVITTATMVVDVPALEPAVDSAVSLTQQARGSIDSRSVYRNDGAASATMTLRVPANDLDEFLADLAELGSVRSTDINSTDVTLEVIDLEARITTLEDSITRLRELQQQSTSVSDLVVVEAELANRQSELESVTARRDYLTNQVDLSTVYLSMFETESGPSISPDFLGGLRSGWDALLTLGAGVITGLGFIAPTAIAISLVIAAVIVIIRVRRRHRKSLSQAKQEEES